MEQVHALHMFCTFTEAVASQYTTKCGEAQSHAHQKLNALEILVGEAKNHTHHHS